MASEVDICNLALAHLGDSATVASINPPDSSAQADHCARFYPMARDALIEMHDWDWTMKRVALSQVTNVTTEWAYCYAQPTDMINAIAVMSPTAASDNSVGLVASANWVETPLPAGGFYTPQPFQLELAADGTEVIYTDVQSAVFRYTARVTDTTKFNPLFIDCLSWSLAAMLAGPVLKGDAGMSAAARCTVIAFGQNGSSGKFARAAVSDSNQKRTTTRDRQNVSWMSAR